MVDSAVPPVSAPQGSPDGLRGGSPEGSGVANGPAGPAKEPDPVAAAREIALRRLTVGDRSRHELAADLARWEVPADVARVVLDRLEEVGLLDDARLAERWVASRRGGQRGSVSRLRHRLRQRGIADDTIDAALSRGGLDDLETARDLAARRCRVLAGLALPVQQRRLAGYLARRGFSTSVVARVVSETLS